MTQKECYREHTRTDIVEVSTTSLSSTTVELSKLCTWVIKQLLMLKEIEKKKYLHDSYFTISHKFSQCVLYKVDFILTVLLRFKWGGGKKIKSADCF